MESPTSSPQVLRRSGSIAPVTSPEISVTSNNLKPKTLFDTTPDSPSIRAKEWSRAVLPTDETSKNTSSTSEKRPTSIFLIFW